MISSRRTSLGSLALLALCLSGPLSCSREPSAPRTSPKKGPVPVVTAAAQQQDVPVELRTVAVVEPVQSTPVRAQLGGSLTEVRVREGSPVSAGQVLFQLDARSLEAAVRQLTANLARDEAQARAAESQVKSLEAQAKNAEAQVKNADSQEKRYEELVGRDFVTREQYEQRRTNADAARAALAAAKAAVDTARSQVDSARAAADATRAAIENAKLQTGYAVIRSPVSGQLGSIPLKQGDLVKANDTLLGTVNQLQPVLVRFTVPEPSLPEVRKRWKLGTARVRVVPPGSREPREGKVVFLDNTVDAGTGTIVLKAQLDNRDGALWPGQSVDLTLVLYTRPNAVVVPSQAVQAGQKGPYVFVVGSDGVAAVRPVKPGLAFGSSVVIDEGLGAGETVVTDGQLRLTPGAKVSVKGEGAAPPQGAPKGKGGGKRP